MVRKSAEAFRTISEVAEVLEVPPHVLRFWETRFSQVKPVKRGGGRRYYRPEDICLLRGIRGLLYDDGMTIKGAQKILREKGVRHVITLGTVETEAEEAQSTTPAPALAEKKPVEAKAAEPAAPKKAEEPKRVKPVVVSSNGVTPSQATVPQGDLFGESKADEDLLLEERPAVEDTVAADKKAKIRDLLVKLEALRATMVEGGPR